MEDFLIRAFLAGLGVVLLAGPLGCFIVWRRMAYFGDSLAHNALLGVALGLLLGIDLSLGVIAGSAMLAAFLLAMQRHKQIASDTLLGLMAHSGLALGLVVLSFFETLRVDLLSYLFGDILAVSTTELAWVYVSASAGLIVLIAIWRPLLAIADVIGVQKQVAMGEHRPFGEARGSGGVLNVDRIFRAQLPFPFL